MHNIIERCTVFLYFRSYYHGLFKCLKLNYIFRNKQKKLINIDENNILALFLKIETFG